MRKGTKTSSFGVSARENHDSSALYKSKLYENEKQRFGEKVAFLENTIPQKLLDRVFCSSSENMKELPDNSVHLMVTSPPYNVGKEYDRNLSLPDYLSLLRNVMKETYRVLATGGRAAINVANIGRKPYIPLHSHIINIMLDLALFRKLSNFT